MNNFLKKLLIFSAIFSIFSIFPVAIINYKLDPYGLIAEFSNNYKTEPNLRSLKNWFVLENKSNYQHLFFSNSRGGSFVFSDSTYYNMSYSMGVPSQFNQDIKTILNNGAKIKSVIIMIDEYSIYNKSENHINQPLRKKYKRNDIISFLNIPLSRTKISSIYSFNEYEKNVVFNIKKDGSYNYNNFYINKKIDTVKIKIPTLPTIFKTEEVFYDLKKIITYLREKNINTYIGVHPISKTNYENNIEKITQLKSLINILNKNNIKLFNELVIIDDKNLNSIFFDSVHYSSVLAQQVINQLFIP
jgi:hypothetical protein